MIKAFQIASMRRSNLVMLKSLARPCLLTNNNIKYFSTNPINDKEKKISTQKESWFYKYASEVANSSEKQKQLLVNVGMTSAGLLAVYGVSSTVLSITGYLVNINFKTVGYWAFGAGFLSSTLCGSCLLYLRRYFVIRPEDVFQLSLKQIEANGDVLRAMGDTLKPGKLRAYNISNGHFGNSSVSGQFGWRAPKIQMLYHIVGPYSEGIVTCEAQIVNGSTKILMLALDVLDNPDGNHELLLVQGDVNRLHVVGNLRGLLQYERIKYLRQYLNSPPPQKK